MRIVWSKCTLFNKHFIFITLLIISVAPCSQLTHAQSLTMRLHVNAQEIHRKLIHCEIEMPVTEGTLTLWYPKWIPGIHAPKGPIENIGGLRIVDDKGHTIPWQRDTIERFKLTCDIPSDVSQISISLDYICSQPSTNSKGIDTFGSALVGMINWNTCLLYPQGISSNDIHIDPSLTLPAGWHWGSALRETAQGKRDAIKNTVQFKTISLHDLIDSPIIMGKHFKRIPLVVKDIAPFNLHLVSETQSAIEIPQDVIDQYGAMGTEAGLLFGGAHFDRYDWLVVCSDILPNMGLEHLESSLNGVDERNFFYDGSGGKGFQSGVLGHELVHSWCGKFRRHSGMTRDDFHTPKDTQSLWIYEGLTSHLGMLLCVRSGVYSIEYFREWLAGKISYNMHMQGRQWRPLEDTAIDSYHLRGKPKSWGMMRRGQDYYVEGAMIWLEIDTIIREQSKGKYSLDDFCKYFLGANYPNQSVLPYSVQEVYDVLNRLAPYDWVGFIDERVKQTQDTLPLQFVEKLGYRLAYRDTPTSAMKAYETKSKLVSALDSIGISIDETGVIWRDIVPGKPADIAGLAPGMTVIGINDHKFSFQRFREALTDSVVNRTINFLILDGDLFKTYTVNYADGAKYLELVRDNDKPDLIEAIYKPKDR